MNWQWLGGFWDGEGSFTFSIYRDRRHGKSPIQIRPLAEVAGCDMSVLGKIATFLEEQFKGVQWLTTSPRREGYRPQMQIHIRDRDLLDFVRRIYPCLESPSKRAVARYVWIAEYLRRLGIRGRPERSLDGVLLLAKIADKAHSYNKDTRAKLKKKWTYEKIRQYMLKAYPHHTGVLNLH